MKKLLLLSLTLFFSYSIFSQSCLPAGIIFQSQEEIDDFATNYPNCTEIGGSILLSSPTGEITNISGLSQLTRIEGDLFLDIGMFDFDSLTGLENLAYIGGSFEIFSQTEMNLEALANLDTIGGDLRIETFENNLDLMGLENLSFVGNNLSLQAANIPNMNGLASLARIGGEFMLDLGSLQSFEGLNNLTSIGGNFHVFMTTGFADFTGLESLTSIGGSLEINATEIESLNGLQSLQQINGQIFIHMNGNLTDISTLNNLDFSSVSYLEISLNDQLSLCAEPIICSYMFDYPGSVNFHGNGPGCQDVEEVLLGCELLDLSLIHYEIFYDLNQNKWKDAGEIFYPDAGVIIDPLQVASYNFSTTTGGKIFVPEGNYTVSYDLASTPNWGLTTDSSSYFLSLSASNFSDTVRFGIYPTVANTEMITMISSPPTRCDEWIDFEVYGKNLGTTITEGTMWLDVDTNLVDVEFVDMPDSVGTNLYGWDFDNLLPSESISKIIRFKIPGPLDFMLGDSLHLGSYITFVADNQNYSARYFNYDPIVRCSYDPNDKLVQPNREGNYTLFEEDLFYTIRFQNTGNDVAYDVVVLDTLDESLDPSTLRILSTSHPAVFEFEMKDNRYLDFSFEGIFLPDSTSNFEGSQGYINYMISPKEGLAEETNIQNTASIYFDTNPPVVTNTTDNLMVSELPVVVATQTLGAAKIDLVIRPNPTTGTVTIFSEALENASVELVDLRGKVLLQKVFSRTEHLALEPYPSGVYFLRFQQGEHIFVEKLIKY